MQFAFNLISLFCMRYIYKSVTLVHIYRAFKSLDNFLSRKKILKYPY